MKVKIIETLEREIEVQAEDVASAVEMAEELYYEDKAIVLDADDFTQVEFVPVVEEEKKPEWVPDFQMLRELKDEYTPVQHGIIYLQEIELVEKKLRLTERDIISLRNLRNFVVACGMFDMDRMSAITHVIDINISTLGGEV